MNIKIVADSSANLLTLPGADYESVPLKIVTDCKEYVDDCNLDVPAMLRDLLSYKGRSGSSCPNVGEWLDAFGDAEGVFTLAITRNLSGSHNSALQAKTVYEEKHPGRKVCCLDTLTTGPQLVLMAEKLRELAQKELPFEQIRTAILEYMKDLHLGFMLTSVDNLAKNGRVSPLIAKAVGFLGIRIVGRASEDGTFQQLHKCRGEKKGLESLYKEMKTCGFRGGRVRISHVYNESVAEGLKALILEEYPDCDIAVSTTGALCSFYAEKDGVLVGYES